MERSRTPQAITCAGWVLAIVAGVIVSRLGAGLISQSLFPARSAATESLIQTLILTALYGVMAWRFVVMSMHRRRANHEHRPVYVQAISGRTVVATGEPLNLQSAASARHLTLVPPVR
jgi:hypothetical protein